MSQYNQNSNTELERKVLEPFSWNRYLVPTRPITPSSMSHPGNNPTNIEHFGFPGNS